VRIGKVEAFLLSFPFKAEFTITRGPVRGERVYVRITADDGTEGWGEASPVRSWSYETPESVVSTINNYLGPAILGMDPFDLASIHEVMDREIAPAFNMGQPIAKSAIDMAIHDLICKRLGVTLRDLFGAKKADRVELTWMVSAKDASEAERITAEGLERGHRGFKVKIGIYGEERDIEILRAVRRVAGEGAFIWADANQGYTLATALRQVRRMEEVGVNFLEQPLPANDWTGTKRLIEASPIPIALDEGIYSPKELLEAINFLGVQAVVIKVSKAGGLWFARQMVEIALSAGIELLGSGLTESRLGFSASCQLFAAYGFRWPVDLNGPQFMADDAIEDGLVRIEGGSALLPEGPGLGVRVDRKKFEAFLVR